MKNVFYLFIALLAFACSSSNTEESAALLGSYTCTDCVYQSIEFQKDGIATLKASELEMPASYIIEGNKVTISIETAEYTLTKQPDGTLEGTGDISGIYSK